eukprot:CAMPEP_0119409050 /NCGR_PEP_ID=MMETSP1335-20130426/2408_1 /TAXON_ID=259385 /ORGANISM="Chrysoculter rhomboideus, Strain RCC1486" /LENGTH=138 /DNA_ID=CAMNT_0007433359 /DNA_START=63 /DNA_END=479 /DNA_ORIENTATION=+
MRSDFKLYPFDPVTGDPLAGMTYNAAQKECHKVSGSDPNAQITEWTSKADYANLFDLLQTGESSGKVWVGFSDWGHPGEFKDGRGQNAPSYIPWFQNEELKAYQDSMEGADCAVYDPAKSGVFLEDCEANEYKFFCDW